MLKPLDRTGVWRTYSMADGLAGMRIEHIAEDSEGYLWFATMDNGVSRFDGDEFQNFTRQDGLINDRVYFILEDSQKRLWFGTLNGVCWYDGADFHHLEDDGIAGRAVQFIYEDREGRIWCGGHRTLGYYDGTMFHDLIPLYLQHYKILLLLCGPNSVGALSRIRKVICGLALTTSPALMAYPFTDTKRKRVFLNARRAMPWGRTIPVKCGLVSGRNENQLWCYADGTFQSVEVDLGGALRSIQRDREGRMWLCTSEGVLYQDGDGFSRFTLADGLPHPAVKAVCQDREHQFWFATWGGGVLYDAHSISVFDLGKEFGSINGEISQIVQDRRGDLWIGYASYNYRSMEESVGRFNGEQFALVGTEDGFDINNCFAICEDLDGTLWFGGRNGLFRYEDQQLKKIKTIAGLGERSVSAIAQDREGQFLFGCWESGPIETKGELYVSPLKIIYQRGEEFQTIFEDNEKKDPFSRIGTVIAGRNGEVYFHLVNQNFSNNDKGFGCWHPEERLKFYGIEDGLIDDNINDLLLDRNGNLWIATLSGLSCFDGSTFSIFTTEAGLPSNRIRCLFEDSQGHLWLGTDGGVVHYDGRFFQTIKSPHIGPVCQILEDRDGAFWFGTVQNSLVRYRQQKNLPQIRLIQVVADQVYEDLEKVIVSTAGQQVIFEYKGMSFSTHPRDMLYVYRLNGYESDWRPATRKMRAHYQDLQPGDYTFQVQAIDRDLNYSEMAQVRLSIVSDPRIEALTDVINRRGSQKFIGHSAALREFQVTLEKIASTNITVLIQGETGVGKGLAARALHALSDHSDGPFIEVNCGALPETLIDSELFGHERGAFTGAVSHRLGRVELAEGGTLFLDEIGDMAVETQVKLLRLLEEGTFERIGSSQTLMAKTRIVAATNRNLKEMVSTGDFREDLYYRLNAFPIYLPPLRERKEDIPYLTEFFKHRMATHLDKQISPLTVEVIEVLQAYHWPGNVRELEHTIQRAVIVCNGSQIEVGDLGLYGSEIKDTVQDLKRRTLPDQAGEIVPLAKFERDYILEVIKATKWKIKGADGAATLLGLPPSTLYTKMKKLGIKRL